MFKILEPFDEEIEVHLFEGDTIDTSTDIKAVFYNHSIFSEAIILLSDSEKIDTPKTVRLRS